MLRLSACAARLVRGRLVLVRGIYTSITISFGVEQSGVVLRCWRWIGRSLMLMEWVIHAECCFFGVLWWYMLLVGRHHLQMSMSDAGVGVAVDTWYP
jgi:hypothetical protein